MAIDLGANTPIDKAQVEVPVRVAGILVKVKDPKHLDKLSKTLKKYQLKRGRYFEKFQIQSYGPVAKQPKALAQKII